jgi:hypothetical protein
MLRSVLTRREDLVGFLGCDAGDANRIVTDAKLENNTAETAGGWSITSPAGTSQLILTHRMCHGMVGRLFEP